MSDSDERLTEEIKSDNSNIKKKLPTWAVVLLVVFAPVWMPLLLALVVVAFSLFIVGWSVVFALWILDASLSVAALVSLVAAFVMLSKGSILSALIYAGAAFIFAGFAILMFVACAYISKGSASLMGKIASNCVGKNSEKKEALV